MAEVTLSPIPYNGGTLRPAVEGHICRLDSSRFLTVYSQINPYYTFGTISTITNIKSATPTVTVNRTQVLPKLVFNNPQNGIRLFRLSSTRVLALYNSNSTVSIRARVIVIDPVTNVMTIPGNDFVVTSAGAIHGLYDPGSGSGYGVVIDENTVIVSVIASGSLMVVKKLTITGDNITSASTIASTSIDPNYSNYVNLQPVPGSPNWVLTTSAFAQPGYTPAFQKTTRRFYGNPLDNNAWTEIGTAASITAIAYLPLTNTTGLVLDNEKTWRYENNRQLGPAVTLSPSPLHSGHGMAVWARWLSPNYFITSTAPATGTSAPYSLSSGRVHKIIRYTDPTFGDTTPGTTTSTPLLTVASGFYYSFMNSVGNGYDMYDNETFILYGTDSSTISRFRIGVITLA